MQDQLVVMGLPYQLQLANLTYAWTFCHFLVSSKMGDNAEIGSLLMKGCILINQPQISSRKTTRKQPHFIA